MSKRIMSSSNEIEIKIENDCEIIDMSTQPNRSQLNQQSLVNKDLSKNAVASRKAFELKSSPRLNDNTSNETQHSAAVTRE